MGLFSSSGPTQADKRQKYAEQCQQAQALITKHRKDIQTKTSEYETIANSQYAYYGWRGSIAFTLFSGSMLVGERIPIFRTYMSWVGLLGGYFIGNYAHEAHINHQKAAVVIEIDNAIRALEPMRNKYGVEHEQVVGGDAPLVGVGMMGSKPNAGKQVDKKVTYVLPGVKDYDAELMALKAMREQLAPSEKTIQEQQAAAATQELTLDDRVDAILEAYSAKKQHSGPSA